MTGFESDPLLFVAAGHLVAAEHSPLRRFLLFVFARYIEVPLLFVSYHVTRGDARFLIRWRPLRRLLGKLLAYPIGRWVDTGSPAPLAEVLRIVDEQDTAIAVGPCRCRKAHGRCDHSLETDMVIRTGTPAWLRAFPKEYRVIGKDEAKEILTACADEGLFHMVFVHCRLGSEMNEYVLCNCCRDGCSVYLLNYHLGQDCFPLIPGNFYAEVTADSCTNCGACVEACPWHARVLGDGKPAVDLDRCYGCGLCERACGTGATVMKLKEGRLPFRTDQDRHHDWPLTAPAHGFFQPRERS